MMTSKILLISNSASLESQLKPALALIRGARSAKINSETPTVIPSNARMKSPRDGSLAKA